MRRYRRDPRHRTGFGDVGLESWVYEYQKVLIDDKQGEIVGFWKQIVNRPTASVEIYGIGGSWFRLTERRGPADRVAARLLRLRPRGRRCSSS